VIPTDSSDAEPAPDDSLPAALSEADLTRRAATLRKRFMRLKDELRARLAGAG